jgi:hypothetical protein
MASGLVRVVVDRADVLGMRTHKFLGPGVVVAVALWIGVGVSWAVAQPAPLPAASLHRLVASPPAPFKELPDSALNTGLMEFGNPHSGKIGTVVPVKELKRARFQRGWESAFRTDDGAIVLVDVFEFPTSSDASSLVATAQARIPTTYTRTPIDGMTNVSLLSGTSREGRSVSATVYSNGRFFVFQDAGGPPGAHDYATLIADLARQQAAAIDTKTR